MRQAFLEALGAAVCSLLLAAPMVAATPAPARTAIKARVDTQRTMWPRETLSGSIMMVDPAQNLLVVKGPDGVPFDMVVRHSTRIESGGQRLMLNQLSTDQGRNVSVRFIPERSGDVARTIRIGG